MIKLKAFLYDGKSAKPQEAILFLIGKNKWKIESEEKTITQDSNSKLEQALGSENRKIKLPDNEICIVYNQPGLEMIDHYFQEKTFSSKVINTFESSHRYILISLFVIGASIFLAIQYGSPYLATHLAQKTPEEITHTLSNEALSFLDKTYLNPSILPKERKNRLRSKIDKYAQAYTNATQENLNYQIEFRSWGNIPNAFALPSGIIIFTDLLVLLLEDDEEIVAIFAHELGHVHHNHGLNNFFQSSLLGIFFSFFLGDITTGLSIAGSLPAVLLHTSNSRKFEREADQFAVHFSKKAGLPIDSLVSAMKKLSVLESSDKKYSWISTHPAISERIEYFKENKLEK